MAFCCFFLGMNNVREEYNFHRVTFSRHLSSACRSTITRVSQHVYYRKAPLSEGTLEVIS